MKRNPQPAAPDPVVTHLLARIRASPVQMVGFWDTRTFQQACGAASPHQITLALQALRHRFVVLQGETGADANHRAAHASHRDHGWMPGRVIIVPKAVFRAVLNRWNAGPRGTWTPQRVPLSRLNVSFFDDDPRVQWLNDRPEAGGRRPKRGRAFLNEQRTLAELDVLTDPTLTETD